MLNINRITRKNIEEIDPYKPGKPISEVAKELGLKRIIKMASNESPLGPSKKAQAEIRKAVKELSLYPEGSGRHLRESISKILDVSPENIVLGNGSNEIIELTLHAFLGPDESIITSATSFLVYFLSAKVFGGHLVEVPLKHYTYDLDAIAEHITDKTKIIFIANPNNPTGTMVNQDDVDRFMKKVPSHTVVVFDEAYAEFANPGLFPDTIKYVKEGRPVVMLRTFSKIYGLAGLRVGYGVADKRLTALLNKVRQPFNVNSLAQIGAVAALDDEDYKHKMISLVREGRQYFYNEFYKLGLFYVPSEANFVLVNVGGGEEMFAKLLRKGVIVRSMLEYGLPEFIRVTVGTPSQNRTFVKELKSCLR